MLQPWAGRSSASAASGTVSRRLRDRQLMKLADSFLFESVEGIADSDPQAEYQESLNKTKALVRAARKRSASRRRG
jgi:hypothetical protein